jgi:hypothetical protein
MTALTDINGIGPALAKRLEAAGIVDCTALAAADPATLTSIPGVTEARLAAWRQALAQMDLTASSNPAPEADTDAKTGAETDAAEASSPAADVVVMLPTAALPLEDELPPAEDQTPKKPKAKKDKGKGKDKAKDKPKTKKKKSKTADEPKKKKKTKKDAKAKKKKAGKKASEAKAKKTKAKSKKKKAKAA